MCPEMGMLVAQGLWPLSVAGIVAVAKMNSGRLYLTSYFLCSISDEVLVSGKQLAKCGTKLFF